MPRFRVPAKASFFRLSLMPFFFSQFFLLLYTFILCFISPKLLRDITITVIFLYVPLWSFQISFEFSVICITFGFLLLIPFPFHAFSISTLGLIPIFIAPATEIVQLLIHMLVIPTFKGAVFPMLLLITLFYNSRIIVLRLWSQSLFIIFLPILNGLSHFIVLYLPFFANRLFANFFLFLLCLLIFFPTSMIKMWFFSRGYSFPGCFFMTSKSIIRLRFIPLWSFFLSVVPMLLGGIFNRFIYSSWAL